MGIQRLISELTNSVSMSDEVRNLYDSYIKVPIINGESDVDIFLDLLPKVNDCGITKSLCSVNIAVMSVHSTVLKTFRNNSFLEDDFI